MTKWKWLFINGCDSKRPAATATEILTPVKWTKCINVLRNNLKNETSVK